MIPSSFKWMLSDERMDPSLARDWVLGAGGFARGEKSKANAGEIHLTFIHAWRRAVAVKCERVTAHGYALPPPLQAIPFSLSLPPAPPPPFYAFPT